MRRGGSTSSSSRTCSACATLTSTASVGLAAPDSRLAQVARGMPATAAICCCVRPARLAQRLDVAAQVRGDVGGGVLAHGQYSEPPANPLASLVDRLSSGRPCSDSTED